jgi:adenine deaminase
VLKEMLAGAADSRRLVLVTDSVDPEGLLSEGYLDVAVRHALSLGLPPELVYRMVTINVAEHFRVDHLVGSLAPGRWADLVLIPSRGDFRPQLVMCRGRVVFELGRATAEPAAVRLPAEAARGVRPRLGPLAIPRCGRVRALELVSRLVTREAMVDLDERDVAVRLGEDLVLVLAVDRKGSGGSFLGLLAGYGLRRGACATSLTWDTTDCVAVAAEERSLRTALGRLEEIGGGAVYAVGETVVAEIAAPVYGLMSRDPLPVVVEQFRTLERKLAENGVPWERPLLSLDTLTTAAIPHLRLSRLGYVRLRDGSIVGLEP